MQGMKIKIIPRDFLFFGALFFQLIAIPSLLGMYASNVPEGAFYVAFMPSVIMIATYSLGIRERSIKK